jgi:hypothetical protein
LARGQGQAYFETGLTMGFIVQSVSKRTGEPPYQITKATKKDALDAAIGFLAQGMKDVTITDEKGQIYSTDEFADLENPSAKQPVRNSITCSRR